MFEFWNCVNPSCGICNNCFFEQRDDRFLREAQHSGGSVDCQQRLREVLLRRRPQVLLHHRHCVYSNLSALSTFLPVLLCVLLLQLKRKASHTRVHPVEGKPSSPVWSTSRSWSALETFRSPVKYPRVLVCSIWYWNIVVIVELNLWRLCLAAVFFVIGYKVDSKIRIHLAVILMVISKIATTFIVVHRWKALKIQHYYNRF